MVTSQSDVTVVQAVKVYAGSNFGFMQAVVCSRIISDSFVNWILLVKASVGVLACRERAIDSNGDTLFGQSKHFAICDHNWLSHLRRSKVELYSI